MYMKNILSMPDVKRRFIENKFGLLIDIIRKSLIRVPFQNVTLFGCRKTVDYGIPVPTVEDAIISAHRGVGGMCPQNNYFLKLQLESIGYNVKTISGGFRRAGVPNNHFLVLIKIAPDRKSPEQEYVIDLGSGVPLHDPIPLNDLPFRRRAGGLNYRFEWLDKNRIQRVNENGDALEGRKPEDFLSPQDCIIDLTPKTFPDFVPIMTTLSGNPKIARAQRESTYCFRYLNITDTDFDIVCIRGLKLMRITKETRQSQWFANYRELRPKLDELFPMLDPTEVNIMVENNKHVTRVK